MKKTQTTGIPDPNVCRRAANVLRKAFSHHVLTLDESRHSEKSTALLDVVSLWLQ